MGGRGMMRCPGACGERERSGKREEEREKEPWRIRKELEKEGRRREWGGAAYVRGPLAARNECERPPARAHLWRYSSWKPTEGEETTKTNTLSTVAERRWREEES